MNNSGSTGITAVIILLAIMLIGVTAMSVISGDTTDRETLTGVDLEETVEDVLNEITTYLSIKDKIGKYYGTPHNYKVEKIAIMISPLVSQQINVSGLTIKINDGENVRILIYNGSVEPIGANTLFEHPIWDELTDGTYGYITTHDKDDSITDFDTINSNTDMAYIIIELHGSFKMSKGETMAVTLFPEIGIQKTVFLEVLDLPIKKVISL
jgi:archaellin